MASLDSGILTKKNLNLGSINTTNTAIPENEILSVNVDDSGNVWAGTDVSGLIKFHPLYAGIEQSVSNSEIKIFPNPFSYYVNFTCDENIIQRVELFNMKSELVCSLSDNICCNKMNTIHLPQGIYLARLMLKNKTFRYYKIMKQ